MSNDRMILRNENSIYMFYEIVEQLEPASILDMGMFLKRAGSVSRKIMDRKCQRRLYLTVWIFSRKYLSLYGTQFTTG